MSNVRKCIRCNTAIPPDELGFACTQLCITCSEIVGSVFETVLVTETSAKQEAEKNYGGFSVKKRRRRIDRWKNRTRRRKRELVRQLRRRNEVNVFETGLACGIVDLHEVQLTQFAIGSDLDVRFADACSQ